MNEASRSNRAKFVPDLVRIAAIRASRVAPAIAGW